MDFYESFRVEYKRLKKTINTCLFLYITGMVMLIIGVVIEFMMKLPSNLEGAPLSIGIITSVSFIVAGDHYHRIAIQLEENLKKWLLTRAIVSTERNQHG